jgi:hypothetical protein
MQPLFLKFQTLWLTFVSINSISCIADAILPSPYYFIAGPSSHIYRIFDGDGATTATAFFSLDDPNISGGILADDIFCPGSEAPYGGNWELAIAADGSAAETVYAHLNSVPCRGGRPLPAATLRKIGDAPVCSRGDTGEDGGFERGGTANSGPVGNESPSAARPYRCPHNPRAPLLRRRKRRILLRIISARKKQTICQSIRP